MSPPPYTPALAKGRTSWAWGTNETLGDGPRLGALAAAVAVAAGVLCTTVGSARVLLGVLAVLTVLVGIALSDRTEGISLLLRPAVAVSFASAGATIFGLGLEDQEFRAYQPLRYAETAGVLFGCLLASRLVSERDPRPARERGDTPAMAVWVLGAAAASTFFLWKGVPILSGDIEGGRVAAASSGTGYLRLLAYLSIPAAIVLVATRRRGARWFVLASLVMVLALANRSPLIYLFMPLAFMALVSNRQMTRARFVASVLVVSIGIISLGTYRIVSQVEFRNYAEYQQPLADGDYVQIAWVTVGHYARIVAQNAVLTKQLRDEGALNLKLGSSYLTPLSTALPGEQLSLDREIRLASGRAFVGGGIPPTLAGEGYVNFGYAGTFLVPAVLVLALTQIGATLSNALRRDPSSASARLQAAQYGYLLMLATGSQIGGVVGASTFPLTGFVLLGILINRARLR